MRRARHILFFLLAFSPLAFSQGGFYQDRAEGKIQYSPYANALVALPGATVTVCTDSTCATQVPLYRNAALTQPLPTINVATADDNGNFSFFAAPGIYWCTVNASGWIPFSRACQVSTTSPLVTSFTQNIAFTGNNSHTGVESFGNINGVLFVDGVKYATIDAAIAGAAAGPATIIIPSNYAGAESANLVTVDGQTRYCGQDNITIWDMRGGVEHNYNQNWGGTVLGSLSRQAITQCKSSPLHTTSAGLFTNYVTGAMPPDLGTVAGLTAQVTIYGTATPQAGGRVAAFEAYTELVPTNVATWPDVRGATYSVNIDRTTAKGNIIDASGLYAGPCTNTSTSGATITNCYSFHAGQPTVATARNYAAFVEGSMLMSNNVNFDMIDGSAAPQHIFTPTPSNDLFIHGLADTHGVIFATAAGTTEAQVNSIGFILGVHLNQTVTKELAGTCAMAAGTSCTFTLVSGAYGSAPVCISTVQSVTVIASGCTVSGTTVTITAASSNSLTWGAVLIGNPN